jgi:hypothetical protein
METTMKSFVEFKGYRTRISYDESSKAFVQATATSPGIEAPAPACSAAIGKTAPPSLKGHRKARSARRSES